MHITWSLNWHDVKFSSSEIIIHTFQKLLLEMLNFKLWYIYYTCIKDCYKISDKNVTT